MQPPARPVANTVYLDLPGPGRQCPLESGEEAQGSEPTRTDLSITLAPREQDVLPPADGALSLEQQGLRRLVVETAQWAAVSGAAPGTVRTYEATLRAIALKVTAKLGPQVLLMSSEDVLYAVFSSAVLLGPETESSVSSRPGVRRGYVNLEKAAVSC